MSFQQGLSGLNATSKSLDVIGNNIANASTFGAKAARAEFADLYAGAISGAGSSQVGIGTRIASIAQQFTQGNITATDNGMDLAINGAGFFQMRDGNGTLVYSRNGQFKVDRDGYIVNNQDQRLLGYQADSAGNIIPSAATEIQLPTAGIEPQVTERIGIEMNLDSRADVTLPAVAPQIDFADPRTYNNATSVSVFDVKGQEVALTYYFQKTSADNWNVYVAANGTSVLDDGAGVPAPVTQMTFPVTGAAPTVPVGNVTLDIPADPNGTWEAITGIAMDLSGATQYGAAFAVTDMTQNGYSPGQLVGLSIEQTGIVTARYSNGQTKSAGQIELANFRNLQGLQALGGNAWSATYASGNPTVGTPGGGNFGALSSGALEESNVDLTAELVNMITAQRIYQANAQTIKTQDQVLQTLVNLR
jgi:flagellar hook protein FlgE